MRSFFRIAISLAFLIVATSTVHADVRHFEDASLRSSFFIDQKEGWVVGDEGVILHTLNGGRTWERQATGLRASLRSVHFLSADKGWVVGREELPYGMGSVGVVLYTDNGGLEWKLQSQLANVLPGLNQVRFVDRKNGFMLGDGSDRFPSGLFKTADGGASWEPVVGQRTTSWLTGDFYDAKGGILGGGWSRLATFRNNRSTLADQTDWLDGRDVTGLQILAKKTLAVGQGGLLLTSAKGGSSWGVPQKILPAEVQASIDFHSLSAVKDKIWIVGRPGSVVLHSADAGATWTMFKTKQRLPLHNVFFFDERTGWAVGDAGTILHSIDGGKTWAIQRQAGQRAAAMTIHSLNRNAPVDTLAILGAADGYLTTSLRVTAPDAATTAWDRLLDARRYAAAIRLAGGLTGETLWQFAMPQHLEGCDKKTIIGHWNQAHANRAEEELIRQLVLSLRIWRPSVIITEHPESKIALSSLLGEAVQEAVRRAADAKAFPEQIGELGLEPWTVRKVYGQGEGQRFTITQDNDAPRDRLEANGRDFAMPAHALLTDRYTPLPKQRTHQLLTGGKADAEERHWMEGLNQKVGESKRDIQLADKTDEKLRQALLQRRTILEMAENLDDPARTLKLLPIRLDELDDEHAAVTAFAVAGRFAERGQWYLAQEIYLYMVDRFPAHPLSADAYRWLIRLNTSSEARRRHQLKHFAVAEPIIFSPRLKKGRSSKDEIVKSSHTSDAKGPAVLSRTNVRDWNKGSVELIKRLGGYGPVYSFDPQVQFCLNAGKRQLGELGASNEFMTKFARAIPEGPWHNAAQAERWLTDRGLPSPRRAYVRYTEVRPFLDGTFDDPCWKGFTPLILDNAVGDSKKAYPTEAMFAYDQEFLYIALKCRHPVGRQVAPVKPRPRDADVDPFDRVSVLLDLDRDYATYYHLEIDQRGCLRDSCCGDKSWNPRWYVAVHSTEDCWQIEAAIPLAELSGVPITQQTAWAFNVARIIPGRGVQSWSQPADVRPRPEGMSLLLFQSGKARPMPTAP